MSAIGGLSPRTHVSLIHDIPILTYFRYSNDSTTFRPNHVLGITFATAPSRVCYTTYSCTLYEIQATRSVLFRVVHDLFFTNILFCLLAKTDYRAVSIDDYVIFAQILFSTLTSDNYWSYRNRLHFACYYILNIFDYSNMNSRVIRTHLFEMFDYIIHSNSQSIQQLNLKKKLF